jgi:hypothetical protein
LYQAISKPANAVTEEIISAVIEMAKEAISLIEITLI